MASELENSYKVPTGMDIIDKILGGLSVGHIHSIIGDSGVGKSWFCQRIVNSFLEDNNNASVLYSDFSGNIHQKNLIKTIKSPKLLKQVSFYRPTSLQENIILGKKILDGYLPNISLIVLDTIFGSPLDFYDLIGNSKKKTERKIFEFMMDLRSIANQYHIPIIITHFPSSNSTETTQDKEVRIDPFCTTKSVLRKFGNASSLKLYAFNQYLGSTAFNLFSD